MKLKQRIENLESVVPPDFDLESWSRDLQDKIAIIYFGGTAPTSYQPAEEFLEDLEQAFEKVYGARANLFGGRFNKSKKRKKVRCTPDPSTEGKNGIEND